MSITAEPKRKKLSLDKTAEGVAKEKARRAAAKIVSEPAVPSPSLKDRVQAAVHRAAAATEVAAKQTAKLGHATRAATSELGRLNAALSDAPAGEMHYRSFYERRDSRYKMPKQEKVWRAMTSIGAMKRETGRIIQHLKQQRRARSHHDTAHC